MIGTELADALFRFHEPPIENADVLIFAGGYELARTKRVDGDAIQANGPIICAFHGYLEKWPWFQSISQSKLAATKAVNRSEFSHLRGERS